MKPSLDEFQELLRKSGGNLPKAAQLLGVTRQTVWGWTKQDASFKEALESERKRVFDKCLDVAYAVAMGDGLGGKAGLTNATLSPFDIRSR